ncbi:hypothetical protein SNEBB_000001 [Seison nebaliae]|nr:hypothetical protein SNEBB_000001 [Seison nebaliae]
MKISIINLLIFVLICFTYANCGTCEYEGITLDENPTELGCDICMCKKGKVVCEPKCEPVNCEEGEMSVLDEINACCEMCIPIQ